MKIRIVQDHTANLQPWFRLEKSDEWGNWRYVDSSMSLSTMRERMAKVVNPPQDILTVIEEIEL